jgi:hypothetical protein
MDSTVRSDPNDSNPTVTRGLDPRVHLLRAKMDRRVKHGDDAGEWVNMTGTRCRGLPDHGSSNLMVNLIGIRSTVRSDPNDSVARSPAGSTRESIFSPAKMDRRVKHGDDAGEWVNMTGTRSSEFEKCSETHHVCRSTRGRKQCSETKRMVTSGIWGSP